MSYNNFDNYYRDENGNVHRDIPLGTSPSDAFARTNKRLKEEVQRIDERIDEANNNIKTEVKRLEEDIAGASDTAKNQIDSAVEKAINNIETLTQRLDSDLTAVNDRIDSTVDTVNASINTEINKVNHRVDNIIANSTATEGNSELIDMRTGIDGTVYETAGTAVREQLKNINYTNFTNINIFDCKSVINGYGYYLYIGQTEKELRFESETSFCSGLIKCCPNTDYCFAIGDEDCIRPTTTGVYFLEYGEDGKLFKREWLSASHDIISITTDSQTAQFSFCMANNVFDIEKLMVYKKSEKPQKYYAYDFKNANFWEQRISKNERDISEVSSKFLGSEYEKICRNNCRITESVGTMIDFSAAENVQNCVLSPCGKTKFSQQSVRVIAINNSNGCWFRLPVDITNWESITLVFWQPYETTVLTENISGYFSLYLNDTANIHQHTWLAGRSTFGWNVVKITKNMFSQPPEKLTDLYFNIEPRESVDEGEKFAPIVFDSVIFNYRVKPTFILNFDQWWQDSYELGAYQYAFDHNIPFTIMTKNYDRLNDDFKKLAREAELIYGCENSYYACYGNENVKLKYCDNYEEAMQYVEELKNDFINCFRHPVITFGASQMVLSPVSVNALLDSGFKLLRFNPITTPPFGYFDKSMYWLPTRNISADSGLDTEEKIKAEIDRLVEYGSVGAYITHGVCSDENIYVNYGNSLSNGQKISVFKAMIDYLAQLRDEGKIQIVTMEDFYHQL